MTCPICRKPTIPDYHPFCSKRCADVDLARWLREDYKVPAPLVEEDGSSDDPASGQDPQRD